MSWPCRVQEPSGPDNPRMGAVEGGDGRTREGLAVCEAPSLRARPEGRLQGLRSGHAGRVACLIRPGHCLKYFSRLGRSPAGRASCCRKLMGRSAMVMLPQSSVTRLPVLRRLSFSLR